MRKQIFVSLAIFLVLLLGTAVVFLYAKGYTIDFSKGKPEVSGTGLLVATSNPDGAQVFINDHLTTATNNTINLAPGTYRVKIFKDGYFPWTKTLKVQKEVVAKAEALLLPTTPKLESITSLGVGNPALDPTLTKIAFTIASQSAKKNGIYILNMNANILTLQSSVQIADDTTDTFSTATLMWSPDGQNIIARIPNGTTKPTMYLLDSTTFNATPKDITETLTTTTTSWDKQLAEKAAASISTLPQVLQSMVKENFQVISWSADETKILYTASQSATLPFVITPPLIGTDSTPQERTLQEGKIYVYDIKEDKNFKLDVNPPSSTLNFPVKWLPDSKHLVYLHDKKIDIMEYDGANRTTVYAGPFVDSFVFPWPNGSKLVILTNLGNDTITPNLYTVSIR